MSIFDVNLVNLCRTNVLDKFILNLLKAEIGLLHEIYSISYNLRYKYSIVFNPFIYCFSGPLLKHRQVFLLQNC